MKSKNRVANLPTLKISTKDLVLRQTTKNGTFFIFYATEIIALGQSKRKTELREQGQEIKEKKVMLAKAKVFFSNG